MMRVRFKAANVNTGASTVNVNSIGVANIFRNGAAVVAGDIPAGLTLTIVYDLGNTRFNWVDVDIPAKKVIQTVFVQDGAVADGALLIDKEDKPYYLDSSGNVQRDLAPECESGKSTHSGKRRT